MCEPSHYILRTDRDECLGYGLIECLPRSLSSLPHQVLYLREGLFYGVEVPGEEYAGRNTSSQPLTSMSSLTLFVLCAPRARQAPPPVLRRGSVPEPSLHVSLEELFVGRAPSTHMHSPIPPSRVMEAIKVWFLPRFLGTLPYALLPLGALALSRSIEIEKPLSSMNTSLLASKREASHFHRARSSSSRSCAMGDFF
jgi:hypothetical protein